MVVGLAHSLIPMVGSDKGKIGLQSAHKQLEETQFNGNYQS